MKSCPICEKLVITKNCVYCSNACHTEYKYRDYIQKWKSSIVDGQRGRYQISNHIRKYLFLKYNSKCSCCKWGEINPHTGKSPLEVDHIDGNPYNNIESNLRLICPNCHSL